MNLQAPHDSTTARLLIPTKLHSPHTPRTHQPPPAGFLSPLDIPHLPHTTAVPPESSLSCKPSSPVIATSNSQPQTLRRRLPRYCLHAYRGYCDAVQPFSLLFFVLVLRKGLGGTAAGELLLPGSVRSELHSGEDFVVSGRSIMHGDELHVACTNVEQ